MIPACRVIYIFTYIICKKHVTSHSPLIRITLLAIAYSFFPSVTPLLYRSCCLIEVLTLNLSQENGIDYLLWTLIWEWGEMKLLRRRKMMDFLSRTVIEKIMIQKCAGDGFVKVWDMSLFDQEQGPFYRLEARQRVG